MPHVLIAIAGVLGAAGVSLAAIAAHVADSTAIRAAAELAMVHAAAAIGLIAFAHHSARSTAWRLVAAAMLLGAILFTGAVALGTLAGFRPIPALAPIGGSLTILSWLALTIVAIWDGVSKGT
ncbi:MAG: DUF423 domain-containing protein [Alphaproteobacteria bacterium]|nr:DUF423 domain-containing protein [Alphaproteobacteria bacterium]